MSTSLPGIRPAGVVLFPGAGSDRDQSTLVAIEQRLAPRPVVRSDFPYRRAGRRAPDRAPVLVQAVRDEVELARVAWRCTTRRVLIGGRSMGGRMCSLAAAEGLAVAGLVLISYPLHPPGRPESLRTAHFPQLTVPCLFVHGTRDPFGTPDELRQHTAAIAGPVTHVWIEGGRHDLAGADEVVADAVRSWIASLSPRRAVGPRG